MLTCDQFRKLQEKAASDPRPLIESSFYITTKGLPGQPPITRLQFNATQIKVHDAVLRARAEGRPPRIIVLKARQPGISTLSQAYLVANALTRPYTRAMVVVHIDEAAEVMFQKDLLMIDRLPTWLKPKFPVPRKDAINFESMPCLDGDVPLHSAISVATGFGKEVWRGQTLHAVHLSEFARFPMGGDTLTGILQCVPLTPDSLVIIESTAQGMGNAFHQEWIRAVNGESDFTPVFIPWYDLPDCYLAVPSNFVPTQEECDLRTRYRLSNEQLQWRRYKIRTECKGREDDWNQEFPTTPEVAFLYSGRPAFNVKRLGAMQEKARTIGPKRGEWTPAGFVEMPKGRLAIWRFPEPDHQYVLSADPSGGYPGGDPAAMAILDRNRWEIIATWHGLAVPTDLAQIMAGVGRWYNNAIMAPEVQNHGYAVVEELKRNFYPNWYQWQRIDKIRNVMTNWLGWETSFRTKNLMIDSMAAAVETGELFIWDVQMIQELIEFQWIDKRQAEGLEHDDLAMAAMIALRVHLEMPVGDTGLPPKVVLPEETKPVDTNPMPKGIDGEVWAAVEREMQNLDRGAPGAGWQEWAQPDPQPGEEIGDWVPPGGWS